MAVNKEDIRKILREELGRQPPSSTRPTTNIYATTQDLIRSAASSATGSSRDGIVKEEQNSTAALSTTARSVASPVAPSWPQASSGKKRKSQTGHPWRLKSQSSKKPVVTKLLNVVLLDSQHEDELMDYPFDEKSVLLKGYVSLSSLDTSLLIKQKLAELFRAKLSLIISDDFDFVKRDRNTVCFPTTTDSWEWDFEAVKTLCGQGKLYCRLKESSMSFHLTRNADLSSSSSSDEKKLPPILAFSKKKEKHQNTHDPEESAVVDLTSNANDGQAPCSSKNNGQVQYLQSLVNELLDGQKSQTSQKFKTLGEALAQKRLLFSEEKNRIKVLSSECLEEALIYFKNSEFDPKVKLTVTFKGQAAVDTGGVTRQFYTNVFDQMITGYEEIPRMFEGKDRRLLPIHNAGFVLSGLMEIVGKMMAHSIIQVGVGFAGLAPCIYQYIVTGDISKTIDFVSIDDLGSPVIDHYLNRVSVLCV